MNSANTLQNPNQYYQTPPNAQPVPVKTTHHNIKTPVTVSGPCEFCHQNVGVQEKRRLGLGIWGYGCLLFFLTGICCWIPLVIDGCYDRELVCTNCKGVRLISKTEYCCI